MCGGQWFVAREVPHEKAETKNCWTARRFASQHLSPAGTKREPRQRKVAPSFAQAFYSWYVMEVFKDFKANRGTVPWHAALKYRAIHSAASSVEL